jgi:hypothetical protein
MPAPIIPWQPSNIPGEIQSELNRRKINRSYKFIQNTQANWDKGSGGDWNSYRGPMTSWIRFCSNGAGHPLVTNEFGGRKERFVLYSGKGFYQSYGFQPPATAGNSKYQVIGYTPGDFNNGNPGEPHIIENSLNTPVDEPKNYPIHVPPPEISRIEVTVQKELYRRVSVEWVCFSWKQLAYMTPYFLVPGITCMVEWGWNHYNVDSLVNLADRDEMRRLWDNAYPLYFDNIIKSKGNYDVVYGIVSNFNWSIEGNKIICTTEITSKDRLYAGIAADYAMSVNDDDSTDKDIPAGIFKDLRSFIKNDQTLVNLKTLVTQAPTVNDKTLNFETNTSGNEIWRDILNPLLTGKPEQVGMRHPHVYGVFSGRPKNSYGTDPIPGAPGAVGEGFGPPYVNDFDAKIQDKDSSDKFWINMGMIVAILNRFSALPSGTVKGKNMFEVDIQNCIIGGHPNMISCDQRVLIPNYQAPKFLYGLVGLQHNAGATLVPDASVAYTYQTLRPIPVGTSLVNKKMRKLFFQTPSNVCFRDNLDEIINYNRYRYSRIGVKVGVLPLNSYSFPSSFDSGVLPESPRGLKGDKLVKDRSGLLSNIYISFAAFSDIVSDENNDSYTKMYDAIFKVLMAATDNFWDLTLMDVDGTITVVDKKYISKYALEAQGDSVYSFDYMDADSIIKSLKFRPTLSDNQATRVIFGAVNNQDSKYKAFDKNDLLDYQFKDCVIGTAQNKKQGKDGDGELEKRKTKLEQLKDLVRGVQDINRQADSGQLQMSLNTYRRSQSKKLKYPDNMPEIIKLVMPDSKLLTLLLNDEDYNENGRYCAVQPGITLELTLQGIGGLRTFQYFIVRHLPPPYSENDIIFRITDVHQTLEAGNWETTIRAQPLPLRGYIKDKLRGPLGFDATSPNKNGWPIDKTL